jgi:hypothetical protein
VRRIAEKHQVSLPGEPPRPPQPPRALPAIPWERNRIWIWDAERHEALWNRAVMKGHRLRALAGAC